MGNSSLYDLSRHIWNKLCLLASFPCPEFSPDSPQRHDRVFCNWSRPFCLSISSSKRSLDMWSLLFLVSCRFSRRFSDRSILWASFDSSSSFAFIFERFISVQSVPSCSCRWLLPLYLAYRVILQNSRIVHVREASRRSYLVSCNFSVAIMKKRNKVYFTDYSIISIYEMANTVCSYQHYKISKYA